MATIQRHLNYNNKMGVPHVFNNFEEQKQVERDLEDEFALKVDNDLSQMYNDNKMNIYEYESEIEPVSYMQG